MNSTFNYHFLGVAEVQKEKLHYLPDNPTANVNRRRNSIVFLNNYAEEKYKKIISFRSKGAPIDEVASNTHKSNADVIFLFYPV